MDGKSPAETGNTQMKAYQRYYDAYAAARAAEEETESAKKAYRLTLLCHQVGKADEEDFEAARQKWENAKAGAEAASEERLNMSLTELEEAQLKAYQMYFGAYAAVQAAEEKQEAARKASQRALLQYSGKMISEEEFKALKQSCDETKAEAEAEAKAAMEELEVAAEIAQAVTDDIEKKKKNLRESRETDTSFVVHRARIECPYGMRPSYLALGPTHGVMTRQIPQMTVKDILLNENIINFGGCHSKENPEVQKSLKALNDEIDKKRDWRDNVADALSGIADFCKNFFCKKKYRAVHLGEKRGAAEEDLMTECVGECIAQFPTDAEWESGHEKVFINGESVMLRKCQLMCNFGGCITILDSGQPE